MRGKLMNKSRTKGLTISELKKNLYMLVEESSADMEVSKIIRLYEKWLDTMLEINLTKKDN